MAGFEQKSRSYGQESPYLDCLLIEMEMIEHSAEEALSPTVECLSSWSRSPALLCSYFYITSFLHHKHHAINFKSLSIIFIAHVMQRWK